MITPYSTIRKTNNDMTTTQFVNTPAHPSRTYRPVTVDVEINSEGLYSPVLEYGRNWQPTMLNALGCASFVLDRPVIQGKVTLVD